MTEAVYIQLKPLLFCPVLPTFSGHRVFWAGALRDGNADGAERVGGGLPHVVARQRRQHQAPADNGAEAGDQGRPHRVVQVLRAGNVTVGSWGKGGILAEGMEFRHNLYRSPRPTDICRAWQPRVLQENRTDVTVAVDCSSPLTRVSDHTLSLL